MPRFTQAVVLTMSISSLLLLNSAVTTFIVSKQSASSLQNKAISFSGDGKSQIQTEKFNVDRDSEIFVLWQCESLFSFSIRPYEGMQSPIGDLGIGLETFKVKRGKHSFDVLKNDSPWTIKVWTSFDDLVSDKEFGRPEILKILINQSKIWSVVDDQIIDLKLDNDK